MINQPSHDSAQPPNRRSNKSLLQRLGCISSLSIFGSGVAFAQTPAVVVSPSPIAVSSPTPTESASPEIIIQTNAPTSPTSDSATPAPVEATQPQSAPVATEAPTEKSPTPSVTASPAPAETYVAPSDIVFSERGSNCEFSMNRGGENCGEKPSTTAQNPKTTGISSAVSRVISSVIRPNFATANPEAAEFSGAEGANSNVSWTPSAITPPSAFLQDYYNRTIRPLGLPGNGDVRLLFPLSIPAAISSIFGWRIHPITGNQRLHTGTDLAAPMGTPVLAALTGRVIMADFFGGYGLSVALEHSNGTQQTLYAHLSEMFVRPGDIVTQGTAIGRVGSTGASTGPHLHFEFRQQVQDGSWIAQDPGLALEQALAQLTQSLQVTQNTNPQTGGAN